MALIATELILLAGGLLLALVGAAKRLRPHLYAWAATAICAAATLAALLAYAGLLPPAELPTWLRASLTNDWFAVFFALFAPLVGIVVCLSAPAYLERHKIDHPGEFFGLILLALAAVILLGAAADLVTLYLGIDFLGIAAYALAGFAKRDARASEAGIKYFLIGAVSSAIMLYGMSLLYGLTGSTNLTTIGQRLIGGADPAALAAAMLILVGLGFKVALVPFHMWCPDAYEGAPTPITAFLSVAPKAGGFAALLRLFLHALPAVPWGPALATLAGLTMTVGNLLAIPQTNIKRMLAYSSIAQAGYIIIGLCVAPPSPEGAPLSSFGAPSVLFYLMAYLLMNLGAFAVVIAVSNQMGSEHINDYAGLIRRSPFLATALALFFLSLAGVPPLAGFVAKLLVFASAIEAHYYSLAIIGVVNSVVSIYYYFNVVRLMFLQPAASPERVTPERGLFAAVLLTLVLTFALGLFPHAVITASQAAAQSLTGASLVLY